MDKNELFKLNTERTDAAVYDKAKKRWDSLSKPIDGLGDLETVICRMAAIQGKVIPAAEKRAAVIMCADNGVVAEGISQSDTSVTYAVAAALGKGISSACRIGKHAGADIIPVDIGIDCEDKIEGVLDRKVARGTGNILTEPAMSEKEALDAISIGCVIVKDLVNESYDVIVTGEMGIGNTTTSAAVLSALLDIDSDDITGRGAGLDDDRLKHKKEVIAQAIRRLGRDVECDEKERAFNVLLNLGGLDIAGLVGLYIGAAMYHVPILIDGLISATAAVLSEMIVPGTVEYMIASHKGREAGVATALDRLGLKPLIDADMALGEGTGALFMLPLIDTALDYYKNGAGFAEYEIEEYKRY